MNKKWLEINKIFGTPPPKPLGRPRTPRPDPFLYAQALKRLGHPPTVKDLRRQTELEARREAYHRYKHTGAPATPANRARFNLEVHIARVLDPTSCTPAVRSQSLHRIKAADLV